MSFLDPKFKEKFSEAYEHLLTQGKLFPEKQLEVFYKNFRERFSPDILSQLDGTSLLETMHDIGNRDSLVYWLEFKNDDVFPSIFGSIAGGSSLKYIIFKRAETDEWEKRSEANANKPVPISEEEAIEIARDNRDKLIAGYNLLAQMPDTPTQDDYVELQTKMEQIAPVLGDLGWVHKYLSLFYPEVLDDYHSNQYQQFHIRKMLKQPPESTGRYLTAWWFVQAKNELDIPMNHLTTVFNYMNGRPYEYWRVGTEAGDTRKSFWEGMKAGGYVSIGWHELGDLSQFDKGMEVEEHFKEVMASEYSTKSVLTRKAREVRRFTNVGDYNGFLDINDIVVAMSGQTVLGIGRVTGSYQYSQEEAFPHKRPVEWLSIEEWKLPETEGLRTTCKRLKETVNQIAIEQHVLYDPEPEIKPLSAQQSTRLNQPIQLPKLDPIVRQIQSVLDRKKQIILYGPPGTGKTYWAQHTANELAARQNLKNTVVNLSTSENQELSAFVKICSFHPAYGYEDFLEGYRPELVDGEMVFSKQDGIFKKLCEQASLNQEDNYYLIIDEINRGDIPRIFGELITLLESDKRGQLLTLPLSGEQFAVPENVYIIGTMNTADRSIALLDTALRRRFGFIEFMPDTSILANTRVEDIPLDLWLNELNKRIIEFVGRDARNLQIGHAYFMVKGRAITEFSQFRHIIREDIIPLLQEYCYEDYDALEKILGKSLVDRNNQRINFELFDINQQDNLIQALLETSPKITTSTNALKELSDEEAIEEDDDLDEGGDEE